MNVYACQPNTNRRFRPGFPEYKQVNYSGARPAHPRQAVPSGPPVNIIRTETGHMIEMALPGLTKEQIVVDVKDHLLVIRYAGEKPADTLKYTRKEFDFNGFERSFSLHKEADPTAIEARFEAGILYLAIPDRKPRVMPIEIR